jgi:site-specific recombinase XerD
MPYLEGIDENNPERVMKQIQSKTTIINKYLKKLSAKANIGKEISTHTARHMVGQILENLGIDLKEIKNSIGHENESQTKTYIKNDKPILVEETAKLIYNELRIS